MSKIKIIKKKQEKAAVSLIELTYSRFIKLNNCYFKEKSMTISTPEREAKKVKIAVDRNPVETSFEKWACDLK